MDPGFPSNICLQNPQGTPTDVPTLWGLHLGNAAPGLSHGLSSCSLLDLEFPVHRALTQLLTHLPLCTLHHSETGLSLPCKPDLPTNATQTTWWRPWGLQPDGLANSKRDAAPGQKRRVTNHVSPLHQEPAPVTPPITTLGVGEA